LLAITQLAVEKNLPREVVFNAVEAALLSAYKKDVRVGEQNITVKIQPTSGDVRVYALKTVVEGEPEDPRVEMNLEEARTHEPNARAGDEIKIDITSHTSGRIAAQTARQVVLQKLREAERDIVFEEFAGKEDELVSAVVQRVEANRHVVLDLGKTEAVLPVTEQVPGETYRPGQRVRVYIIEVSRSIRGPQVIVSRTHRNFLRRLFELEVPEIFNGLVELKALAREPGQRSKVAVAARQEGIDPVGACIGLRGIRIQNIVNELGGEKVDVVEWSEDPAQFVANALSPAQVVSVECDTTNKTATVIVPDLRLSLAIGKQGQNARLAAKLTGWRIDIKSVSVAATEALMAPIQPSAPPVAPPAPEIAVTAPATEAEPAPAEARAPAAPTATVWEDPVAPQTEEEAEEGEEEELAPPVVIELPKTPAPAPLPSRIRFAEEIRGLERRVRQPRPEEAEGARARRPRRVRPSRDEDELGLDTETDD
jgi:N utilization substance protein A